VIQFAEETPENKALRHALDRCLWSLERYLSCPTPGRLGLITQAREDLEILIGRGAAVLSLPGIKVTLEAQE